MSSKAYADPALIEAWLADREGKTFAGRRALNELVSRNKGLVGYWTRRFWVPYEEREDFFAAGMEGLLQGFRHFDPNRGSLANCLRQWVKSYLLDHMVTSGPQARNTQGYRKAFFNVRRATSRLTNRLRRDPTPEEIAREIGEEVTKDDVESVLARRVKFTINLPKRSELEAEEGVFTYLSGGMEAKTLEDEYIEKDLLRRRRRALREELKNMKEKERLLITRRYLHPKDHEKSMSLLGLGTRQNASLIDQSARRKLREALSKRKDLK